MDSTINAIWFVVTLFMITTASTMAVAMRSRRKPASAGSRRAPPVLSGAALLGFIRTVLRDGPLEAICVEQSKMGSVFTASFLGLVKVTFLGAPEVSSHFYRGSEEEISQGDIYKFTVPMFGKGVAYDVDLDTRNEQDRFHLDALKPRRLRTIVASMVLEVEGYFSRWGDHGTVDLKYEMEQILMLIASRTLVGKEVRENMFDEVCSLFRDLANGTRLISVLFPYLPIPAHSRRDKARARLTEIFTDVVRSRRSSGLPGAEHDDILQSLIDSRYKDGRATTEAEITGLLLALFHAGKHTSSSASTWTGVLLLTHQNHLAAAVAEQDRIAEQHGDDRVDAYDVLQEMTTLHCCIKEALRIHPPAVALIRQARESFTVRTREGEEYDIPGGHTIASPIISNHQLPYVYKDPHVYDPDRFSHGREEDKVGGAFSYLAFSAGKHMCMGEAYAYAQIKAIWSHLLRKFELEMISPFPVTEWKMVVPQPKGKVMVSYKRRKLPRV